MDLIVTLNTADPDDFCEELIDGLLDLSDKEARTLAPSSSSLRLRGRFSQA